MSASGSTLKIIANSKVWTIIDPKKSATSSTPPISWSHPHP
jgi:hypothetical protein